MIYSFKIATENVKKLSHKKVN